MFHTCSPLPEPFSTATCVEGDTCTRALHGSLGDSGLTASSSKHCAHKSNS